MDEDQKTLRALNASIKDSVHSLNVIQYAKLEMSTLTDQIGILEKTRDSYEEHIERVKFAMRRYLTDFRKLVKTTDPLKHFLTDYQILSQKWEHLNPDEWYVPPPFNSQSVSKFHISLRHRTLMRTLTIEAAKAARKSRMRYYYFPLMSVNNAAKKDVYLQQKLSELTQEYPFIRDGVIRLSDRKTDLELDINRLQTYIDDEYLLFSAIPEFEQYTDEVRKVFTSIRDVVNPLPLSITRSERAFYSFRNNDSSIKDQINVIRPVDVRVSAFAPMNVN